MNILVTIPFNEKQKLKIENTLKKNNINNNIIIYQTKETVTKVQVKEADVILGNLPVDVLKDATSLKWLQLNSAGANQYCKEDVLRKDVILTNSSGAYSISVSENMLAYTLAMMKKIYQYQCNQNKHLWHDEGHVMSIEKATVLIVGMGDIGKAYAKKIKALGGYVIGVRRTKAACPKEFDEAVQIDELDEVIKRADVTAIALPGTDATEGLFTEERIRKMKRGSYLINVGRGNIVDLVALDKIMKEGYLGGAALDVTVPEPLPKEHFLWDTPNVWITPHITGGYHIDATLDIINDICCENLKRYLEGKKLLNIVDRKHQY